jgi:hypothetical protein
MVVGIALSRQAVGETIVVENLGRARTAPVPEGVGAGAALLPSAWNAGKHREQGVDPASIGLFLSIPQPANRLLIPVEVWPHVAAALAAHHKGELTSDVRESDVSSGHLSALSVCEWLHL